MAAHILYFGVFWPANTLRKVLVTENPVKGQSLAVEEEEFLRDQAVGGGAVRSDPETSG